MAEWDVVVIGFGAAGACAAIEAADAGARVLVVDRGYGGGASTLSGGVVYAGGGTRIQRDAGVQDDPDNMFAYLRQEVGGVVSDETLRRFCVDSPSMIEWLTDQGCEYRGTVCDYKTSYPTDRHYLYYSGNEKAWPYVLEAEPAARGHRQVAPGMSSGKAFFSALRVSAERKGVVFRPLTTVQELITTPEGAISGLRVRTADDLGGMHRRTAQAGAKLGNWVPPVGNALTALAERRWAARAYDEAISADAVVISAGGFIANPRMRAEHGAPYADVQPLGTVADDGSGIALATALGGATAHMERMTAWRFLSPPSAFMEGVTVGPDGARIANEDLYGATHSERMVHDYGGRGFLVLDSTSWKRARRQIAEQTLPFQAAQARYVLTIGHRRADSLDALARKLGVSSDGLERTVTAYNDGQRTGAGDPAHKAPDLCRPLEDAPFYGVDISVKNSPAYPAPGITLGGLVVDEATGGVQRGEGITIEGLYAAGRSAVGLCSTSYVSGLSLADAVFSGRRAGAHAAASLGRTERPEVNR